MTIITPSEQCQTLLDQINDKAKADLSFSEREFLIECILKEKPKKVVEIGVYRGGSSAIILSAMDTYADSNTHLYAVDLRSEARIYPSDPNRDPVRESTGLHFKVGYNVEEDFSHLKDRYTLLTGQTIHHVIDEIGGDIDLCFIDTVHTVPGEILDFLSILPYLKKDAFVIFHDTNVGAPHFIINLLLMSAITGDKYMPLPAHSGQINANIGAIKLNQNTEKNIFDVFNLFGIPWRYDIGDKEFYSLVTHFSRFYPSEYIDIFTRARNSYTSDLGYYNIDLRWWYPLLIKIGKNPFLLLLRKIINKMKKC